MTAALNNFDPLDRTVLVVGVAAGDQTVTAQDLTDCDAILLTGGAVAGRNVTFATRVWQGPVCAEGGNAQSVTARQGTIAIAIPPGDRIDAEIDGSANGLAGTPVADASILLTALDLTNVKARVRSISLADGDQAPAASVLTKYGILRFTGAGGSGDTVTLQPVAWRGYMGAEITNAATVTVAVGSGSITLAAGEVKAVILDGSANGITAMPLGEDGAPSWLEEAAAAAVAEVLAWIPVTHAMSPYQAVSNQRLQIDASGGAIVIVLPAAPTTFAEVEFSDEGGTIDATHTLTIQRNGKTIMSAAADIVETAPYLAYLLRINQANDWRFHL